MRGEITSKPTDKNYRDKYDQIDWSNKNKLQKCYQEGFSAYESVDPVESSYKFGTQEYQAWEEGYSTAREEE